MSRERLPNRRATVTETVTWGSNRVHISAGLATNGRVLECFVAGAKVGSERDQQLDDEGVLLSRLLQHGDRLVTIAAGIGRLPGGAPATLIGVVIDRLLEMERELS